MYIIWSCQSAQSNITDIDPLLAPQQRKFTSSLGPCPLPWQREPLRQEAWERFYSVAERQTKFNQYQSSFKLDRSRTGAGVPLLAVWGVGGAPVAGAPIH